MMIDITHKIFGHLVGIFFKNLDETKEWKGLQKWMLKYPDKKYPDTVSDNKTVIFTTRFIMLKKAIMFLIAGVFLPYIGMWFAGTYMLGNGTSPNSIPIQLASMLSFLLSVGLYFLTKIEKNILIKVVCILLAIAYPLSGIYSFLSLSSSDYSNSTWQLTTGFFFQNCIAALVALLVFRNCRVIHNEI